MIPVRGNHDKKRISDKTKTAEVGENFDHGFLCIFRFFATRDDQFAGSKEKHHHFRRIQPVDKSGELFGLVYNLVKIEPHGNLV